MSWRNTVTPANAWIKWSATMMALITLSGCATGGVSEAAVCDGTEAATTAHAADLANDGGPLSQRSGRYLIELLDAACLRE